MSAAIAAMTAIVLQKPHGASSPGMRAKFIPKMPEISVSGIMIVAITVSTRIVSLSRLLIVAR
jgi:hypothetical protein